TNIPANGQIAAFLDEAPFNGASTFTGSFFQLLDAGFGCSASRLGERAFRIPNHNTAGGGSEFFYFHGGNGVSAFRGWRWLDGRNHTRQSDRQHDIRHFAVCRSFGKTAAGEFARPGWSELWLFDPLTPCTA